MTGSMAINKARTRRRSYRIWCGRGERAAVDCFRVGRWRLRTIGLPAEPQEGGAMEAVGGGAEVDAADIRDL